MPGASNMIDQALRSAIDKESTYHENIERNHAMTVGAATRLKDIEPILERMAKENIITQEEAKSFIDKQRKRLIDAAEKNVQNERDVKSFVAAATQLRQQERQQAAAAAAAAGGSQDSTGQDNAADDSATKDYGVILEELVEKNRAENNQSSTSAAELQQAKYVREVTTELGIEQQDDIDAAMMDDDGDDVVMMNNTLASQAGNLKCPITGSLLEDPVRNKVCKHVYSREGIMQHIRQMARTRRACHCPFPGCGNNVREDQLEHDTMTEMLVKRERRRQDLEKQQRASQASMLDSDDED